MYNTKQLPSGEVEEIVEAESWDAPNPFSVFPLVYLFIYIIIGITIYLVVRYSLPILWHIPPVSTPIG